MKNRIVIDPEREIEHLINSIKTYFVDNGGPNTKAVIGISGGKDSTVAAALLVRALGADRVVGVMMPQSVQTDIDDSRKVCEILGIQGIEIDIGPTCNKLYHAIDESGEFNHCATSFGAVTTNVPARIRMTTLYAVAAMVGGRVINTGNLSERYVGYTTKYGDLAGDYAILKNYTVREVYMLGDALEELPYALVHKAPADGMSGQTDEGNMGFTYEQLDDFLLEGIVPDVETMYKIKTRHDRNTHKEAVNIPCPMALTRGWNARIG